MRGAARCIVPRQGGKVDQQQPDGEHAARVQRKAEVPAGRREAYGDQPVCAACAETKGVRGRRALDRARDRRAPVEKAGATLRWFLSLPLRGGVGRAGQLLPSQV